MNCLLCLTAVARDGPTEPIVQVAQKVVHRLAILRRRGTAGVRLAKTLVGTSALKIHHDIVSCKGRPKKPCSRCHALEVHLTRRTHADPIARAGQEQFTVSDGIEVTLDERSRIAHRRDGFVHFVQLTPPKGQPLNLDPQACNVLIRSRIAQPDQHALVHNRLKAFAARTQ